MDIAPTILDVVDLEPLKRFYGKSLTKTINDDSKRKNSELISEMLVENGKWSLSMDEGKRRIAVRRDNWKFIYDEETGSRELYNLESDSKEKNNIFQQEQEIAKKLERKVREHIAFEIKNI